MKKSLSLLLSAILLMFMLASCGDNAPKKETFGKNDGKDSVNASDTLADTPDDYSEDEGDKEGAGSTGTVTLGDEFVFEDLQIRFFDTYDVFTYEDEFSEQGGQEMIKLPVSVINVGKTSFGYSSLFATEFGSNGTELEDIGYLMNDGIDQAGYLRPGCGTASYVYMPYDGDGEYAIEFDNFEDRVEVVFDIKKENACDVSNLEQIESENRATDGALDLDSSFTFDGFDVKFGGSYEKTTISDEYSDYYNREVIRIPITVENNSGESSSFYTYNINAFGSRGTQLSDASFCFEDGIENTGEMRDGVSASGYLYYLYDGQGLYALELSNFDGEFYNIEFNVD